MVFKDRQDAGKKLASLIKKQEKIKSAPKNTVVVSLLRGGAVVANEVSKKLKVPHIPLVVSKISAPNNDELAIGALCFDISYLEKEIVSFLQLDKELIKKQIDKAKEKFANYSELFGINKNLYKEIKDKTVFLIDDGVATGSSAKAAVLYLRTRKPKTIIFATPVVPGDFDERGFDKVITLHKDPQFSAVSRFYQKFPQVSDKEVENLIK